MFLLLLWSVVGSLLQQTNASSYAEINIYYNTACTGAFTVENVVLDACLTTATPGNYEQTTVMVYPSGQQTLSKTRYLDAACTQRDSTASPQLGLALNHCTPRPGASNSSALGTGNVMLVSTGVVGLASPVASALVMTYYNSPEACSSASTSLGKLIKRCDYDNQFYFNGASAAAGRNVM